MYLLSYQYNVYKCTNSVGSDMKLKAVLHEIVYAKIKV